MNREQLQKVRDALAQTGPYRLDQYTPRLEAIAILDAALAAPEQEPFCYVNVNAQGDVTRTIKREDKWCKTPLYRHPAPQSQPVARVTGYYAGNCVIEPLDGKTVFSSGMAVYNSAPPSRKWQGLADQQILAHRETQGNGDPVAFARAIEAALRAKNTGEQA